MMQEFRDRVLTVLNQHFTAEQMAMIDCAVRDVGKDYEIQKKKKQLLATLHQGSQREIDDYLSRKRAKGCARGTLEQYRQALQAFNVYNQKHIREILDTDVLDFLDKYEMYRKIGKRRKDGLRKILNGFFRYMADCGRIHRNPMSTVDKIKIPLRLRHPLSSAELTRVRRSCKTARDLALVDFLFSTGCRVSEVVSVNRSDIDYQTMSIRVIGKGDKERCVFLNTDALVSLNEYFLQRMDQNDALFVSERNPHQRLSKTSIEKIIRRLGETARLSRRLFPHLFRHTMATYLYNRGMRIEELQVILGHSSADTTQIYARQDPKLVQQAYFRIAA